MRKQNVCLQCCVILGLCWLVAVGLTLLPGCGTGILGGDNNTDNITPTPTIAPTAAPTPTPAVASAKYITADVCATCHRKKHDNWGQTAHAKAFDDLKAIGQDNNTACIPCHTLGYGDGGFVDAATTPKFEGVQCANCHDGTVDHVSNVEDKALRPTKSIAGAVCGKCHTDAHHPTYDEWSASSHGEMVEHVATYFNQGKYFTNCGPCHSGDYRQQVFMDNNTVTDAYLQGVPFDQMNPQTCAVCHDPHQQTGNDVNTPDAGKDYQLRYSQIAFPTPSDNTTLLMDPTRFNICGQCHHSRGANWTATARGPHTSIQANTYVGEMDTSDNKTALVAHESSIHAFVPGQCSTCHMYSEPYSDATKLAISGHSFEINLKACYGTTGCHPNEANVTDLKTSFQGEIQSRLDAIKTRLGDPATWEYSSSGGPTDQKTVSDAIKKVRFLYYWVINDGSLGVHNPEYVRSILTTAENLLTSVGK